MSITAGLMNIHETLVQEILSANGKIFAKFRSHFIRYCFMNIKKSYKRRSTGAADQYGSSWKPTKKFLKNSKSRMMIDTGKVIDSFTPGVVSGTNYSSNNEDQLVEVRGATVTLGSKVKYIEFLKRKIIPRSIVTPIMEDATSRALKMIRKDLEREIKKAWKEKT